MTPRQQLWAEISQNKYNAGNFEAFCLIPSTSWWKRRQAALFSTQRPRKSDKALASRREALMTIISLMIISKWHDERSNLKRRKYRLPTEFHRIYFPSISSDAAHLIDTVNNTAQAPSFIICSSSRCIYVTYIKWALLSMIANDMTCPSVIIWKYWGRI